MPRQAEAPLVRCAALALVAMMTSPVASAAERSTPLVEAATQDRVTVPTARVRLWSGGLPDARTARLLDGLAARLATHAQAGRVKLNVLTHSSVSPTNALEACEQPTRAFGRAVDLAVCLHLRDEGDGRLAADVVATPAGPADALSSSRLAFSHRADDERALLEGIAAAIGPTLVRWTRAARVHRTEGPARADGHVRLEGPGTVSVDGAGFVPLPLDMPVRDGEVSLVVVSGHCPQAYVGTLDLSQPRRVDFDCRPPEPARLLVSAERPQTRVHLTPTRGGADHHFVVEEAGQAVVVETATLGQTSIRCDAAGTATWRVDLDLRAVDTAAGPPAEARCRAVDLARLVYVTTDTAGTTLRIDGRPVRARPAWGEGVIGPTAPVDALEPGRLYWLEVARGDALTGVVAGRAPARHALAHRAGHLARRYDLELSDRPRQPPDSIEGAVDDTVDRSRTAVGGFDGPLSLGLSGGVSYKHQRLATQMGLVIHLRPAWTHCLAFDGGLSIEQAEEPIFLSRRESETRLTRGYLAARCQYEDLPVRPFAGLGAFYAPSIAIGPWLAAGASLPLPFGALDLTLASPVYVADDKLGHFGFEAFAALRIRLPGETR